jgi:FKBP-type peptidyl-prolyl cis-trans isomerase FkpA
VIRFIKIYPLIFAAKILKKMKKYFTLLFVVILFSACLSDDQPNFKPQTEADIIKYIEDNNLNAEKSNSGLYYVINNKGTGATPSSNSNVTVAYKGYFLDGTVFDQSNSNGITFNLQQVIKGWTEGITYFKEGGNGMLLVPSNLGYGANGRGSIPGGAVLVFDIKLISVN